MDPLEEQLKQLSIINSRHMSSGAVHERVAAIEDKANAFGNTAQLYNNVRVTPKPPPLKKNSLPECPEGATASSLVLLRKQQTYSNGANNIYERTNKVTLDNPAILDAQLEALAHHKKQLERKGLLSQENHLSNNPLTHQQIPKLSSTSLIDTGDISKNLQNMRVRSPADHSPSQYASTKMKNLSKELYSNIPFEDTLSIIPHDSERKQLDGQDDEITAPPSPVSSSYSELRRATDVSTRKEKPILHHMDSEGFHASAAATDASSNRQAYANINNQYSNTAGRQSINNDTSDYYGFGGFSQTSSTYESIYEPINPRPPSQQSSRSNFLMYSPYTLSANGSGTLNSVSAATSMSSMGTLNGSSKIYPSMDSKHYPSQLEEVDVLTDYLVNSLDTNDADNYGICYKCNERVLGENTGCTAMDQVYHIDCFTCSQCQINLQGKPFYAVEDKPFCEYDYLQTLEKCSVCMNPILERILRATGKPYHPQCFTCVVCGNSLDGVPFTVDATNQNYCIADFHKKFAPRCCVCKEPIMPEPGEEETVRVVALDRSFHFECYKCEDCGLLLSSEAEGRGCYPLDGHVLCKCCNAKRVQMLTDKM